jgi:hypothetical protein
MKKLNHKRKTLCGCSACIDAWKAIAAELKKAKS